MNSKLNFFVALFRRNFVSIAFPSCVCWSIYADWSHTRNYKLAKAREAIKDSELITQKMPFIRPGALTKDLVNKLVSVGVPMSALVVGWYLDKLNDERYRSYHNKSALYGGRDLKPGERLW
ncbi:hypothetical protein HELRODRAFT_182145 [Helobdella robusta]|uniref:Uncharacterized protein n=1 Tax=Helobdella robusta TaxID=6412 RepID=T1FHT8_HELRO|nr:hypothetical protein HELRODRAFT_182145 [Helobdella robusta]ESN91173.1 hypothetical protein HELRODRAFT_182145 [Helobdella robusta]